MRVLLDTNVLISAFIARGLCADLLEYCALSHPLVASSALLEEFQSVLVDKFHFPAAKVARAVAMLKGRMMLVAPADVPRDACRDADDLAVLATAVAGACDCVVTGDKDLLSLQRYANIDILSPHLFWRYEADRQMGGGGG